MCTMTSRRKNLGYLWAIEHGADEVYETDDDNLLLSDIVPTFDNLEYYVFNRYEGYYIIRTYLSSYGHQSDI